MHCMAVALGKKSEWWMVGGGDGIESLKSHAKFAYD